MQHGLQTEAKLKRTAIYMYCCSTFKPLQAEESFQRTSIPLQGAVLCFPEGCIHIHSTLHPHIRRKYHP
jgi:hypothetical protein